MIKEISLTIKPTLSCNMKCRHCFNGDALNTSSLLPVTTTIRLLEIASKEYEAVKITFHGGEPSLAGVEYYKRIFEFQKEMARKYNTKFHNNFTTNGLALTEQFMDLLVENDVMINLSFDGPYNSILRQQGDKVYKNVQLLQNKKARMRIFCTLSEASYRHLMEIYMWFNERQLNFKILPIEKRGYAKNNNALIMNKEDFVDRLTQVYKFWVKDKNCKIRVYTFEEFVNLRPNVQFKPFWFNRKLALNPDGFIYPFGRPNDVHFCLGRPEEIDSLDECFESDEYRRLKEILNEYHTKICPQCDSKHICNGVAVCMSYMYVSQMNLLRYSCRQSNLIFSSILRINDDIKKDFIEGKEDEYSDVVKMAFSEYLN